MRTRQRSISLATIGERGMKTSLLTAVSSLFSTSDEQAMGRVQSHDDAHAFAQLVGRWETPIQRLCSRMLGDPHRGEDLAQDTFARLFAKRKEYQPTGRFSTFLWRIAVNLCYDELRRRKRRPETTFDEDNLDDSNSLAQAQGVGSQAGPDALLSQQEEGEIIRQAVLGLSDTYRSVIILRHYENLKFREIGEVLGVPEGTVKSRMAEALTQLHRALSSTLGDYRICHNQDQTRAPGAVSHPSSEEWMPYLYGELPRQARAPLDAHLKTCHECRQHIRQWQRAMDNLNGWQWKAAQRNAKPVLVMPSQLRWALAASGGVRAGLHDRAVVRAAD